MSIVIAIFTTSVFVSSLYWLVLFVRLSLYKSPTSYNNSTNSSILISAKNEERNLQNNLPFIINQNANKEIIILDDFSQDSTEDVVKSFSPDVIYHRVTKNAPGKKKSLTEGVDLASYENILLTDADCLPATKEWAAIMTTFLNQKHQIVLGYGAYEKLPSWLNSFVRFETATTAIQYFTYNLFGLPYMGVGRNLAFSKTLFKKTGGYKSHENIISGDDDLFIRDAATAKNVAISLNNKSFTISSAPHSLKQFIQQKKRHISTSYHYRFVIKCLLGLHPLFFLCSSFTGFILMSLGYWKYVLTLMIIRWALLMVVGFLPFRRLNEKDLIFKIPFLDLCWIPYYLFFSFQSLYAKPKTW